MSSSPLFTVDILDSSSNVLGAGPLANVLWVELTEELDRVGQIKFAVPATDPRAIGLLASGIRMRVRTVDGNIANGLIHNVETRAGREPVYEVSGPDELGELLYFTAGYTRIYDNVDVRAVIIGSDIHASSLLENTGWDRDSVEDYGNATIFYDGESIFQALSMLARQLGRHLRLGSTPRTLDFGTFGASSGIRISNVSHVLVAQEGVTDLALVGELQVDNRSGDIENRIFPLGKGRFDLRAATNAFTDIEVIYNPGPSGRSTTLTAQATAGTNVLTVANASLFTEGEAIFIGDADDWTADHEVNIITIVTVPLQTIAVENPLGATYPIGADVVQRPQFYIEDAASQAAYGLREACVPFQWIAPIDPSLSWSNTRAANMLYTAAAARLARYKDPYRVYQLGTIYNLPADLRVGELVRLVYRGLATVDGVANVYVDVDEEFYVTKVTRRFEANGQQTASLEIANVSRPTPANSDLVMDNLEAVRWLGMSAGIGSPVSYPGVTPGPVSHDPMSLDATTGTDDVFGLAGSSGQRLEFDAQAANTFLAGPATGANDYPAFRALVAGDMAHTLLGPVHSDVATQAVSEGSMIRGSATPAWDELAHPGVAYYHLQTDATSFSWLQNITLQPNSFVGLGPSSPRIVFEPTGNELALYSGLLMGLYSDAGVTPTGEWDASTGDMTLYSDLIFNAGTDGIIHPAASTGMVLLFDGMRFVPSWLPSTSLPSHALLGVYHSDVSADTVSQGSLIVGNATPQWDELTVGSAYDVLRMNAGGTDPEWTSLFDVTVPTTIVPDASAAAGSATTVAHRDHTHGIAADVPVNIGTSNVEGSGTAFARNDHVHAHPSGLGANLHHNQIHALATTAGLGADHTTSGLTAGQVLRATGATTAAFQNLQASDLPSHTHAGAVTGGSLQMGTTDTNATAGSIFFAGTSGVLQEKNAYLFWNDSTNRLGVYTNTPRARVDIVAPAAGTVPALMLDAETNGEIVTPDGDSIRIGHYNSGTTTFTERFRLDGATTNMVFASGTNIQVATGNWFGIGSGSERLSFIAASETARLDGACLQITGAGGPPSGAGLVLEWDGSTSDILSYNYSTIAYLPIRMRGSQIQLVEGTSVIVTIDGSNIGLRGTSVGGGVGVLAIANAGTNPSSNPSGGGILYSDAGAGKWRGSSGTTTTFGPAEPHCPTCGRDFVLEWSNLETGHLIVCMWCLSQHLEEGIVKRVAH